jgi:EAL domain-containing protein (putative c-di-GMP-specific phosphodiesterase class I)
MGLTAVAEGVGTAPRDEAPIAPGCQEAQGYLYARPLSVAQLEAFLRDR